MKRASGFTLLEIIVVLAIGAAIYFVVLSGPLLGKASAADLKAAARTLASGLRQAQTTAMATRREMRRSAAADPEDRMGEIVVAGTHNEQSVQLLAQKMEKKGVAHNHPHVFF